MAGFVGRTFAGSNVNHDRAGDLKKKKEILLMQA